MKIVVDEIFRKENIARLEIGNTMVNIPCDILPNDAVEGDILLLSVDRTNHVRDNIEEQSKKLFQAD